MHQKSPVLHSGSNKVETKFLLFKRGATFPGGFHFDAINLHEGETVKVKQQTGAEEPCVGLNLFKDGGLPEVNGSTFGTS